MIPERFKEGLSFEEYLSRCSMNVPTMRQNFEETMPGPESHDFFRRLCQKMSPGSVRVLVLSEDWCGDCVENVPVVAKLASLYPVFDLRIFPRDENPDIMKRYLTEGKSIIPTVVFFDERGEEIGRFVERPQGAHRFLESYLRERAPKDDFERKQAIYRARAELRKLYRASLREETIREIATILRRRFGEAEVATGVG